jgi:cytochrome c-type biogenesis protein
MVLFTVCFIAGVLTVLAPCILPILPVILGVSAVRRNEYTPYVVIAALAVSVILFTFLLKVTTLFAVVPQAVWAYLSGSIIMLFGVTLLVPSAQFFLKVGVSVLPERLVKRGIQSESFFGDVVVGTVLGPIFASCSPTYFFVLAVIIPAHFFEGVIAVIAYVIGLSCALLVIAQTGGKLVRLLSDISNPNGFLKRMVGVVFIILGLLIMFGIEKRIEAFILEKTEFDVTQIEYRLLRLLPD